LVLIKRSPASSSAIEYTKLPGAAASKLRLPALSHDLQIDYTALSFVAPEKVRFKYKLEGEDNDSAKCRHSPASFL
jgi:hypothetical protein